MYFVKNDYGVTGIERDAVGVRERGKETVEVAHLVERFLDGSLAVVEVNKDIRLVFVLSECFYDGALANSSGPFDEEGFADENINKCCQKRKVLCIKILLKAQYSPFWPSLDKIVFLADFTG